MKRTGNNKLTGLALAALLAGGMLAPRAPGVVVPIARRVLREMVGHLVLDATPSKLGPAIAKLREDRKSAAEHFVATCGGAEQAREILGEFLANGAAP